MSTKAASVSSSSDYSGVSTRELADLIRVHTTEGEREGWARANGISMRVIRCVLAEERQWTSLHRADSICVALGVRLDDELAVIPGGIARAAEKMARDELETAFEFGLLSEITTEDIDKRVLELNALREDLLGPPTVEQLAHAAGSRARQRARNN